MAWYQTLTLAQLTRSSTGAGLDLITPQSLVKSEIRRGTLISFSTATWKATLHIDGSMAAVTLPCATWLQPVQLTAGRRLAVLLFDASNPADGLVIGTYGYPGWALDLYPNNDEAGLLSREVYRSRITPGAAIDDFDGSTWAAGWAWAGAAPFTTPTVTFAYPSCVSMCFAGAARAFRYRTDALTTASYAKLCMANNTAGTFLGHRLDDGSDNNYVEFALRYVATNQYDVISRVRTGGAAVTTTVHKVVEYPIWVSLSQVPYGTLWSNWGAWGEIAIDSPGLYTCIFSSGLTWTPTRRGLHLSTAAAAATWEAHLCDWYK
jgi:hypothetical protein